MTPKRGGWPEKPKAEAEAPAGEEESLKDVKDVAEREADQAEETTGEPETGEEQPEKPAEPEPGPLSKLQAAVRELLDYDQIGEIRLALYSREAELEKHAKKGSDLGVREEDARRRLHVIRGDSLRFGLTRIFAPEEVTEQRDVFFDREKPNGRPDADISVVFVTEAGEQVTCTLEQLRVADKLLEIQKLWLADVLPASLEQQIRTAGLWHLVEGEEEAGRALAEVGGVEA